MQLIILGVIEREKVYREGDQVRLNYACQLGDHVHQFVNGQITHISVGVIHGRNPPRFPPTQEEVSQKQVRHIHSWAHTQSRTYETTQKLKRHKIM